LVAMLDAMTRAPTGAAPDESVTPPLMEACCDCASAAAAKRKTTKAMRFEFGIKIS
jgi:hypothetical protein